MIEMTDDPMALPSDRAFVPSASSPAVSPVPASIPSADTWRTDSPPFGQSPIWQYVWVQGEKYHSGQTWFRHGWGLATIRVAHADDHYRGYRRADIETICKNYDIDFALGPVIVGWLPAEPPALLEEVERPSLEPRDDGEWAASAIEARRAATGTGAVHESAAPNGGDVK
jgi:hypothetical protein